MTNAEVRTQAKATALNEIRKIYHPKYNGFEQYRDSGSYPEQRDYMVRQILSGLERELEKLKLKSKQNEKRRKSREANI